MTEPKVADKNKFTGRYIVAVGRRKTAIARVRLYADKKHRIVINEQPHTKYLQTEIDIQKVELPLKTTNQLDVSISAKVVGGGPHSQAEAVRHGIARALLKMDKDYRMVLKPLGLITRDPRQKERKKPGLKRARRAPQWAKR